MISICQTYNDFKAANNVWQLGHFRPQSFITALHNSSLEVFNELRKEQGNNQVITDALRPFYKRAQLPIKKLTQGGVIAYPTNYVSFAALRYLSKSVSGEEGGVMCSDIDVLDEDKVCRPVTEEDKVAMLTAEQLFEHDIKMVDTQRWGAVSSHQFLKPSNTHPYATQDEAGLRIAPEGLGTAVLYFLAIPDRPTFIYTRDAKHNIVCDPTKCVNLLWGEEMLPEIMSRLKTKYASFVSNPQKYAEGVKETQIVGS